MALSPRVDEARRKMGIVLPGEGEQVAITEITKYDTLAIANAGTTASLDFFQQAYAPQTTNIKSTGHLIENGLFIAEGMGFQLTVTGDNQIDDDLTSADVAQALINYLNAGYVTVNVNDKLVLEDIAIGRWPAGFGPYVAIGGATTATTTSWTGATVSNGFPSIANRRNFKSPIVLTNEDVFALAVRYGTAIAWPSSASGILRAYVWGTRISDGER